LKWSAGQGKWTKIGEVVDAVGQNRKQLYEGKEWDYVFKVDIKDGVPPLSLPYNATGMHACLTGLRLLIVLKKTHIRPRRGS
jgi:hypothetical protein